MNYLLDTNICIYLMKNSFPELTAKILGTDPKYLKISAITVFELMYGAEKSHHRETTHQNLALFLSPFGILSFNDCDATLAGKVRGYLEKKGTPVGPYDTLIAAQALSRHLTLVTHNTREFLRIPNLRVEDWTNNEFMV